MAMASSMSEGRDPVVPVEFCKGVNGLDKIILREVRGSSAEVYLYGAHVTSWKNDHREEMLFVSNKAKEGYPINELENTLKEEDAPNVTSLAKIMKH